MTNRSPTRSVNKTERSIYYRMDLAMSSANRPPLTAESAYATTHISAAVAQVSTPTLRRLYFVRFAFALVWAALMATTASSLGAFAIALLIAYPAADIAAAIVDGRSASRAGRWPRALVLNIAISAVAVVGLTIACGVDIAAVLRVWGAGHRGWRRPARGRLVAEEAGWSVADGVVRGYLHRRRRQLHSVRVRRGLNGHGRRLRRAWRAVLSGIRRAARPRLPAPAS